MAQLLAELFRQSPSDFFELFCELCGPYANLERPSAVQAEWPFPSSTKTKRRRFADLAILNSAGDPIALVEIKDADLKKLGNAAQLKDYISYSKKRGGVELVFLSRGIPSESERRVLAAAEASGVVVHRRLFSDLYAPLRGKDAFSKMLRRYLEDIAVGYRVPKRSTTIKRVTEQVR